MNPLSYSNQSAQPQQAGSSAALTSAQLSQAVSSAAAVSQLVCSGAAFLHIGRSVSAELRCVSSSAYAVNLLAGKKNASNGSVCQPASKNVAQPFL